MPQSVEIKAELDLGDPPEEILEWAKENIGEDPEKKCQILSDFRDMIYSRGECDPHRTDDAFLLRFLRARSFKLESAYKLFVNYYDFKESNPEFFKDVDLEYLKKLGEHKVITSPPYREQTGRRIVLYRMGNWDPEIFTTESVFQGTMIMLELGILEQITQILGGIAIFDLGGLCMQQAWHMTPSIAQKVVQIIVTSFPMRTYAIHVVRQSWVFDAIYSIFKPFLHEKMKERIFFHGDDMESLHQHIDPKYLPEIYGGIQPEFDYNDWVDHFYSNKTVIKEMKSLGYRDDSVVDEDEDDDKKD